MRSSKDETVQQLVGEFVHKSDILKLKPAFVRWQRAFCFSVQNRMVFAPAPGEYRWPTNCYAMLSNVQGKSGRARHRTKKQRRKARNKFLRDCKKIITSLACSTGLSSFAFYVHS